MPKSYATNQTAVETASSEATAIAAMNINDLVHGLAIAKATEEVARTHRIKWEERITEKLGGPEDGQETTTLEDGTKVTISRGYLFAADCEGIQTMYLREGFDSRPPIRLKRELKLDAPAYKALAKTHPNTYRKVAKFVTVKPKKTSIAIKAPKA